MPLETGTDNHIISDPAPSLGQNVILPNTFVYDQTSAFFVFSTD